MLESRKSVSEPGPPSREGTGSVGTSAPAARPPLPPPPPPEPECPSCVTATNAATRTTTPPAIAYGHHLPEVERTGDRLGFDFVRPDDGPPRFSLIVPVY